MTSENDGVKDQSRRKLLSAFAIGGAAVAGGVVGGVSTAAFAGTGIRREQLTVDVACDGNQWKEAVTRNPVDDVDFRVAFLVEGWIYPEGTVPEFGFVPVEEGSIGRWICRGWTILHGGRPEPHVASTQEYLFGPIKPDDLFPGDMMSSNGIEGTETPQITTRAITGGTGKYLGATGMVTQANNGTNTTVLNDGGDIPAPNFIFKFDYWVPDEV